MAAPLNYQVKPTKIGPDANEELQRLIESLHEHGVLRFANDLVCSKSEVASVLVAGLSQKGSLNAIQNLSVILIALSQIEPAQFYRAAFALKDAFDAVGAYEPGTTGGNAPGLGGAWKMLNDERLWSAMAPLLAGLQALSTGLARKVDKPISEFTGKPSNA